MAVCVVCGRPVVNPVPTQDGGIRHKRCAFLSPEEARDELERVRRKQADPKKR